jgi:hypothetical protein
MNENRTLFQLTADMAAIEDALYETGGELTPEIEEALQETAQSLAVKTDSYNALMRKFSTQADVIDAEIKRLTAIKKTCQNAEKRLREHICDTMPGKPKWYKTGDMADIFVGEHTENVTFE